MAGDGLPDAFRLNNPADAGAFRRWFTFLAEAQFYNPGNRPAEIVDCSALLRYAYREALRNHDGAWAREANLPLVPAIASVRSYSFPRTPVGANLFRVRTGEFQPSDLRNGSFAAFADANTLKRLNTFFVGRDVHLALPGDLFFYRANRATVTFHSMIYLGRSQFEPGPTAYVVYHTGPEGGSPGELRRRSLEELLQYPEPQWRPTTTNPCFLGVFRWNILRQPS